MGILSAALVKQVEDQAPLSGEIELNGVKFKVGSRLLTPADFEHVNTAIAKASARARVPFVSFQNDPSNFTGQVELLVRKLYPIDEDGALGDTKAFSVADKPVLMRLGVDKVAEMFSTLFKDQVSVDVDDEDGDIEKN